ncbi:MAG: alkaline phosphatase D family protein [Planctomycetales bacterium]|nr:alkaline phosphatase D family protein [Planctomycetales bacterium]
MAVLDSCVWAQESKYFQSAPPDAFLDGSTLAYYGSENEWSRRQFSVEKADKSRKRQGQRQLLGILDGKSAEVVGLSRQRIQADPTDLESHFTLAIAYSQLGEHDQAFEVAKKAIDAGLPIERFLAGPRHLLQPLLETESFQKLLSQQSVPILHGPMLGCVSDHGAKVWVRTAKEETVTVKVYACDPGGVPTDQVVESATAKSDAQVDYTAIVDLSNLQPGTEYAYDVTVGDIAATQGSLPRFHTFPPLGSSVRMQIAFGGGAGYIQEHERMWDTVSAYRPDALFLLGDNVYIDLPEKPRGLHRYTYYRRQSRPEFRRLVSSTPVFSIWDDHDCAMDDVWMGPFVDRPSWKPDMLTVFRENWVNPAYGNSVAPGCWYQLTIGDVDFFFLDTRYYRTNPFGEKPTMLGPIQKAWLLEGLKQSQATFKVLVSSVPWAPGAKPGSHDTWDGFLAEREEIFSAIETQKIDGVLLLSADRHRSDAWKIDRPGGYALYDMMSSKLTNEHTHECFAESIFCYNEACSFGLLSIDTSQADSAATYQVINIDGKVVHTLPLRKNQLSH